MMVVIKMLELGELETNAFGILEEWKVKLQHGLSSLGSHQKCHHI